MSSAFQRVDQAGGTPPDGLARHPGVLRGLGVYAFFASRRHPRSYLGKIMLVAFLGTHVPLLVLFSYAIGSAALSSEVKVRILLVALLATLVGTGLTLFILSKLLAPISLTALGVRQYLEKNAIPPLPTEFSDEAGILMADTLFTLTKLDGAIQQLRNYDPLTSLPNRAQFGQRLEKALAKAQREQKAMAVMVLDLDGFAALNNSLGLEKGDSLLRQAAQRLSTCTRDSEALSRIGSDEFAIFHMGFSSLEDVDSHSRRMLQALAPPFTVDGGEVYMSASIGAAIYPSDETQPEHLLANADAALRMAKQQGRNTYRFYSSQMNEELRHRLELERDLHGALERGELELFYQPQMDMRDGSCSGLEALLRWRHPVRGMVLPAEFIPVAEASGMIVPIGEWVLGTACQQSKDWQSAGFPPLRVAVNLSALQFQQPDLTATISGLLRTRQLDPALLELEITESLLLDNVQRATSILQSLHGLGITLALDDFGTGYSSLNYLKRLPLDILKIDRSFVQGVPADANDAAIIHSVVALAKGLKLEVIAEGVETGEQVEYLTGCGCYRLQGFYFSRPMPAEGLARFWGTMPVQG